MKNEESTSARGSEYADAAQAAVDAGIGGVQMRVRDESGDWAGSTGVVELGSSEPPSTEGRFWLGSTSKPFTAALVLQLVDDGALSLDSAVADHVTDLALDSRITVRMLLQHTSGLYNYTGELAANGEFVPGIAATGAEWVDDRFRVYTASELVRFALDRPALFEPGSDQSYSNTNYTLASLLTERITGRSRADQLRDRILEPLGLTSTVVPTPDQRTLPAPHSHGYYRYLRDGEWTVSDVTEQNASLLIGAGDLISTTADLHSFITALLTGRLLSPESTTEMITPNGKLGLGLGLWVQDLGEAGLIYHHNGGAPGGYGSLMISTRDASRTLTAGLTTGDAPIDLATVFPEALGQLISVVFAVR